MAASALAAEITVSLDRCAVLNDPNDNSAESKVALHFALPDEVVGQEIIYAELYAPVRLQNQETDLMFELILFPLLSDWTENNIDYENSEAITDSLSAGAYTVSLGSQNEFRLDITSYIMATAAGERTNYGLVATADLLGDDNIRLPENLGLAIKEAAKLKIIYKYMR